MKELKTHEYQFEVWKKSMKTRYFIESVIFLGLAVFFQIYVNNFNNYTLQLNNDITDL